MKRKIIITFFIIILTFGFCCSKVFAETNIKETISGRFPNYDVKAEYKVEVTDNTDKKIIVKFKDMTIIESYAENRNGKLDLKSLSRISYSEPSQSIFNSFNLVILCFLTIFSNVVEGIFVLHF